MTPDMHDDIPNTALLFKPVSQIALIDSFPNAADNGKLLLSEAVVRANKIPNWSMSADLWQASLSRVTVLSMLVLKHDANGLARLLPHSRDDLDDELKLEIWRIFNHARGNNPDAWIEAEGGGLP
jgi:hypothetical protein